MARRKGNQIPVPRNQSQPVGRDNFKQAPKSEFEPPPASPVNPKTFLIVLLGVSALIIVLLGLVKR
jgi:hypothetical protein